MNLQPRPIPSLTRRAAGCAAAVLTLSLAAPLAAPSLQAQGRRTADLAFPKTDAPVRALRLEVEDSNSGRRVLNASPCQGLTLLRGDRVRLRLVGLDDAADASSWESGQPLAARFFLLDSGSWLETFRPDPQGGEIGIQARGDERAGEAGVTALLGYEILSKVAEGVHRRGAISVLIKEPGRTAVPGPPPGAVTSAQEMVRRLYLGILLREPDAAGAAPRIQEIAKSGHPAVVSNGLSIARSEEAKGLSAGGAKAEDRLGALYKQLLGLERDQVEPTTWGRHYGHLVRGEVDKVVEEILLSREFRQLHGYSPKPSVYYEDGGGR